MEINYRHRRSPSSDRFLGLFSSTAAGDNSFLAAGDDELHEAEFFWTTESTTHRSTSPLSRRNPNFRRHEKSGILAALPDVLPPVTTPFRSIPKPPPSQQQNHRVSELTQSAPSRKFQHSAPVNVPAMMKPRRFSVMDGVDENAGDGDDGAEEMLPPHEIVAMKLKSTSSVLEGVGRTLKGRDLRQVRNAVWSRTGFLD